jgi:hypothetical protein
MNIFYYVYNFCKDLLKRVYPKSNEYENDLNTTLNNDV